jgi:hypothetical protein
LWHIANIAVHQGFRLFMSVHEAFHLLEERLSIRQLGTRDFTALATDLLLSPLDYIIDGASDHIQPRNDFVRERMVVATLCPFLFKFELQRLYFTFKLKIGNLKVLNVIRQSAIFAAKIFYA